MNDTLQEAVKEWHTERKEEGYTEALDDLLEHGCQSGMVSGLIYYKDTTEFYEKHREEISTLLYETMDETGSTPSEMFGDKWDEQDPLALKHYNQNLLAWFAFEETARTFSL